MLSIRTNNVPRLPLYGSDLSPHERAEFDYLGEDLDAREFVRFKGHVYDLGEFSHTRQMPRDNPLSKWDGVHSDSFFSGVCIRWCADRERVVVGQFFA